MMSVFKEDLVEQKYGTQQAGFRCSTCSDRKVSFEMVCVGKNLFRDPTPNLSYATHLFPTLPVNNIKRNFTAIATSRSKTVNDGSAAARRGVYVVLSGAIRSIDIKLGHTQPAGLLDIAQ